MCVIGAYDPLKIFIIIYGVKPQNRREEISCFISFLSLLSFAYYFVERHLAFYLQGKT